MKIVEKLKIDYIAINALVPNTWNSNVVSAENEKKLEESLKRNDVFSPILVRQLDDGTMQILGGEHRTKVAKNIGIKELPCVVLKNLTDSQAKEISLTHNSRYGSDDNHKLSELLGSLDDFSIISEIMPFDTIEIEALLSASKVDYDSLEVLGDDDSFDDNMEIPSTPMKTHTILRFKVSMEDASTIEEIIDEAKKINGFTDSDALTNAGDALVSLLIRGEE